MANNDNTQPQIFRGKINGQEKYCRILIRRRRAPLDEAIKYFKDAIFESNAAILECSGNDEEKKELYKLHSYFMTAIESMLAVRAKINEKDGKTK